MLQSPSDTITIDGSIAPTMDGAQVERMLRSGVTAFNWTVCRPQAELPVALSQIVAGIELIERSDGRLRLIRSVADIHAAKRDGAVGLIFGPQGARPVEGDVAHVRVLRELGVRILQLTYNERNLFGDGCTEPANGGISVAGRELVTEINRQHVVLDLAHAGERTILEAIDASSAPAIISHANARAVFPSPRNATDAVLDAIAACGGVIGLTLWSPMVGGNGSWPTIDDFLRHVAYVAERIGPHCIGLGSDHSEGYPRETWESLFSATGRYPSVAGLMGDWYGYDTRFVRDAGSCLDLGRVADGIASLGFSAEEMAGILGGNFIRVFERVWA
jgi:membrane dipeptidase